MTDRDIMKQALDALENHEGNYKLGNAGCDRQEKAVTAPPASQPEQQNKFNPDWDVMAVMLEEHQRMAKRIEELEAQQCKYPTCQSEEYQQLLVSQIKRELIGEFSPRRPVPQFTTLVRKMWSGSEVQQWINENWNKIPD